MLVDKQRGENWILRGIHSFSLINSICEATLPQERLIRPNFIGSDLRSRLLHFQHYHHQLHPPLSPLFGSLVYSDIPHLP